MQIDEKNIKKDTFKLEEFNLFGEFINVILLGYIVLFFVLFFFSIKYLIEGRLFFTFLTIIVLLVIISSIISAVKSTGTKIIKLSDQSIEIKYVKFKKVLAKRNVNWKEIVSCSIKEIKSSNRLTGRQKIILKLKNKTIILGENIKNENALNLKKAILDKLNARNL